MELLGHPVAGVRRWTIRLLGDDHRMNRGPAGQAGRRWRPPSPTRWSAASSPRAASGGRPTTRCRSSAAWFAATRTRATRTSRTCSGGPSSGNCGRTATRSSSCLSDQRDRSGRRWSRDASLERVAPGAGVGRFRRRLRGLCPVAGGRAAARSRSRGSWTGWRRGSRADGWRRPRRRWPSPWRGSGPPRSRRRSVVLIRLAARMGSPRGDRGRDRSGPRPAGRRDRPDRADRAARPARTSRGPARPRRAPRARAEPDDPARGGRPRWGVIAQASAAAAAAGALSLRRAGRPRPDPGPALHAAASGPSALLDAIERGEIAAKDLTAGARPVDRPVDRPGAAGPPGVGLGEGPASGLAREEAADRRDPRPAARGRQGQRRPRQADLQGELRRLPQALRRRGNDRPRPDRRRARRPRFPA